MARLFRCLILVTVVVAVILAAVPNDEIMEPSTTYAQRVLDKYGYQMLEKSYGNARNYSHKQVRRLYHDLLADVAKSITALSTYTSETERAELCSTMRASVRRYSRSRDGSLPLLTDFLLQLRDAYTHGLRYLPVALRGDVKVMLREKRLTLRRTLLTLKQTRDCAMPFLFGQCPSYNFLREVRGKTDSQILGTCTTTNKLFDRMQG